VQRRQRVCRNKIRAHTVDTLVQVDETHSDQLELVLRLLGHGLQSMFFFFGQYKNNVSHKAFEVVTRRGETASMLSDCFSPNAL